MVKSLERNNYTEVLTLTREEKDKQREEQKEREEARAAQIAATTPPTKKRKLKGKKHRISQNMSQTLNCAFQVKVSGHKCFGGGSIMHHENTMNNLRQIMYRQWFHIIWS